MADRAWTKSLEEFLTTRPALLDPFVPGLDLEKIERKQSTQDDGSAASDSGWLDEFYKSPNRPVQQGPLPGLSYSREKEINYCFVHRFLNEGGDALETGLPFSQLHQIFKRNSVQEGSNRGEPLESPNAPSGSKLGNNTTLVAPPPPPPLPSTKAASTVLSTGLSDASKCSQNPSQVSVKHQQASQATSSTPFNTNEHNLGPEIDIDLTTTDPPSTGDGATHTQKGSKRPMKAESDAGGAPSNTPNQPNKKQKSEQAGATQEESIEVAETNAEGVVQYPKGCGGHVKKILSDLQTLLERTDSRLYAPRVRVKNDKGELDFESMSQRSVMNNTKADYDPVEAVHFFISRALRFAGRGMKEKRKELKSSLTKDDCRFFVTHMNDPDSLYGDWETRFRTLSATILREQIAHHYYQKFILLEKLGPNVYKHYNKIVSQAVEPLLSQTRKRPLHFPQFYKFQCFMDTFQPHTAGANMGWVLSHVRDLSKQNKGVAELVYIGQRTDILVGNPLEAETQWEGSYIPLVKDSTLMGHADELGADVLISDEAIRRLAVLVEGQEGERVCEFPVLVKPVEKKRGFGTQIVIDDPLPHRKLNPREKNEMFCSAAIQQRHQDGDDASEKKEASSNSYHYSLWQLGSMNIILRRTDRCCKRDVESRSHVLTVVRSKLEYLKKLYKHNPQKHVNEGYTSAELAGWWADMFVRGRCVLMVGHALMPECCIERVYSIRNIKMLMELVPRFMQPEPSRVFSVLKTLIQHARQLPLGSYIISHNPAEKRTGCYMAIDPETAKGQNCVELGTQHSTVDPGCVFDLHKAHSNSGETDEDAFPYVCPKIVPKTPYGDPPFYLPFLFEVNRPGGGKRVSKKNERGETW